MGLESETGNRCGLCWAPSLEQRLVFKSLFKKLKILLSSLPPPSAENACGGDREGFLRLVRAGRLELPTLRSSYQQCTHDKWQKLFRRGLRCSPDTLDALCETIASKISERAYHFWLLEAQIKNAAHSVGRQNLTAETAVGVEGREGEERERRKEKEGGGQEVCTPPQQQPSGGLVCYPSAHTTDYNSEHINVNAYGYYYTVPYYYNSTP